MLIMSFDSSRTQNEKTSSNQQQSFEFIPLDLEKEMEEAMNEPLPDVVSVDEFLSEDCIPFEDIVQDELIEVQIIQRDSKKGITAAENNLKTTQNLPNEFILKNSGNTRDKQIKFTGDTAGQVQDSSFDFGFSQLSLQTPVKHYKVENDNLLSSQPQPKRQMFGNWHTHTSSHYGFKTPEVKPNRFSISQNNMLNTFKTPFKSCYREPTGISKLSSQLSCKQEFSRLNVNGSEYIVLKVLGRGGSSVVHQCFDVNSKENRAIKCVSLDSSSSSEGYMKEIELLKRLQHCDRIIRLLDHEHLMHEKKLYVVLEMGSADMSQILKELSKNTKNCPYYLIQFYWMEMLYAVQQIHHYKIIHSDLKPANFLLVDGRLKLIDFGISSLLENDSTSVIKPQAEGSWNYISPEALNPVNSTNISSPSYGKTKYKLNFKADVWSLGCILYQLIYKKTPFQHIKNLMQKLTTISNSSTEIEYPSAAGIPKKFLETVKKCLIFNRDLRPSVDELILDHEQFCEK